MPLLFAYGSMLNCRSASRTLQRKVSLADYRPAWLSDYVRTWTAKSPVYVHQNPAIIVDALFLDLSYVERAKCNGALIEVSDEELKLLDVRESQYERTPLSVWRDDLAVQCFAYVVPKEGKAHSGIVLSKYLGLLQEALAQHTAEFTRVFWQTTRPLTAMVVDGEYRFIDERQSKAAGR